MWGISKLFKKKKPETKFQSNEDISFYLDSHLYAINLGLRGIVDKLSKQRNSDLIYFHLEQIFKDGYDTGYQNGHLDALSKRVEDKLTKN